MKHVSVIKTSNFDHYFTCAVQKIGVHKQIGKTRLDFYDYSHFTPENISQVFSNINWNPEIVMLWSLSIPIFSNTIYTNWLNQKPDS